MAIPAWLHSLLLIPSISQIISSGWNAQPSSQARRQTENPYLQHAEIRKISENSMHMDAYRTIIDIFSYQVGWREKLYDIVSLIMFYPSCKLGFGVSTRLPKCFQEQKLMILPFSIQENWDMSYGRWLPPSQNADRQIWRETEMTVRLSGLLVCIPSFWFDTISQNPMFECVWCLKSMRILCLLLFLSWSKLSFEMFWEIIGASLGAARRRHPRPYLAISWHCLEGGQINWIVLFCAHITYTYSTCTHTTFTHITYTHIAYTHIT